MKKWIELLKDCNKYLNAQNYDKDNFHEKTFLKIINAYYSRPFHNLNHIDEMLIHLDLDFDILYSEEITILRLSIWFHDYIYEATKKENKRMSALSCKQFMEKIGIDEKYSNRAYNLIIATKHDKEFLSDKLQKIICDLDLRKMGTDNYFKNDELIRKEYNHLTNKEWKEGRIKFLKIMLTKPYIFNTSEYRNKYETITRENILEDLKKLQS